MKTAIEVLPRKEADLRAAFWEQVGSFPEGFKIKRCLQCGTCSGTCPVSHVMDLTPRQVVAMFRAGHIEEILRSRTIWLCASCYACTVRCPSEIRLTDTMYALKRIAMGKEIYPSRFPVYVLSRIFLNNVYRYGRNYELGLGIKFFARTGIKRLISNTRLGWSMIRRGRLGLVPKKLRRVSDIQAIIRKANEFGEG